MTAGSIVQKPEMVVIGLRATLRPQQGIGALWKQLYAHLQENGLDISKHQQIGMIFNVAEDDAMDYMAGFIAPSVQVAKVIGLDAAVIAESEFAVVDVQGEVPTCIMAGIDHLAKRYIPGEGYKVAGPFIEAYAPSGNPNSRDYQMQVWVPVKKKD